MRFIRSGFLLCSVALCAMSGVAQSQHWRAEVPFSFKVDKQVFPAGTYDIAVEVGRGYVVLSDSRHSAKRATWLGMPSDSSRTATIRFNVDGDQYTLNSIAVGSWATRRPSHVQKNVLEASIALQGNDLTQR